MADYISQFTGGEIDARLRKVSELEAEKQDALVSGENIKTVGGQSVLGSGDIPVGDENAVKFTPQTLTDAQKAQALANIGAASLEDVANMDFVIVTSLPTASASTMGHIYLVGPDANDNYDRYVTKLDGGSYSWVTLGSTQIDLSDYATKAEVDELEAELGDKIDYHQETPTPVITQNSYVEGSNGAITANGFYDVVAIDLGNAKEIVFVGLHTVTSGASGYAFYDENGGVVSSHSFDAGASALSLKEYDIPIPDGAVTFKASRFKNFPTTDYYYYTLVGNTVSDYVERIETLENVTSGIREDVNEISVQSNNILDLSGTTDGKQISVYGTEISDTTYCYSKKIAVIPGQKLFQTGCVGICAYNGDTPMASKGINGAIPIPWTVPENITHIRTNFTIASKTSTNFPFISVGEQSPRSVYGTLFPKATEQAQEGFHLPLSSSGAIPFDESRKTVDIFKINSENVLDLSRLTPGYIAADGTIVQDASYLTSDYIPVQEGDTVYLNFCRTVCAFNEYKRAVPAQASSDTSVYFTYVVPNGIYYIRTYMQKSTTVQAAYPFVCINHNALRIPGGPYVKPERILPRYRLFDAFAAWKNGISFPVGFVGDSTTDGVGTTGWNESTNGHVHQDEIAGGVGKADYDCALAYPHILQDLLRAEFGNNNPKIYNIGYSGAALDTWAVSKMWEQVFAKENDLYCNCRMVGINFGINDRNTASTEGEYIEDMVKNLVSFVEYLLSIGITPFMVTSQVVLQAGGLSQSPANLPQNYMQRICNETKEKVARMYGLEVVDMNTFTALVLQGSNYPIGGESANRLMDFPANLHFADKGHELEAGFLFGQFVPYVMRTDNSGKVYVGLTNRNARSNELINLSEVTEDKFKMQFNGVQGSATDTLIYDTYVLVDSLNGAYSVKYLTPVASGYIVVDGDTANPIQITDTEMNLGTWDIGLHHIQVYTGASTTVAFKGFLLESVN